MAQYSSDYDVLRGGAHRHYSNNVYWSWPQQPAPVTAVLKSRRFLGSECSCACHSASASHAGAQAAPAPAPAAGSSTSPNSCAATASEYVLFESALALPEFVVEFEYILDPVCACVSYSTVLYCM